MRVFLTGATGFLGAVVAQELCGRGHDCIALARQPASAARLSDLAPEATVVQGDFFDSDGCRALMAHWRSDALIHCGWGGVPGAARNDPAQLENAAASTRLASAALAAGVAVLIGVGSQAEYGARSSACDEADAPAPETLYGVAKLAACGAFMALGRQYGARVAWARVFSLYGPGQTEDWLVGSMIRTLMRGEAPALTRCEQMWEFTHVRDAARAIVALLESPGAAGVFNVASGTTIPLREAVLMLRDLAAPEIEPEFGRIPYRPDQVMRLEARIERMRAMTGWAPGIGLRDGFAETVAAFARERRAP